MTYEEALGELRSLLSQVSRDSADDLLRIGAEICAAKEGVRARYVPIFSLENIDKLTAEDFKSFLLFKNNHHWDSLHRQGGRMTGDMPLLRKALKILVDEGQPARTRLNRLRPGSSEGMVRGLGRAVITGILQVLYPEKYGVLNNTAEAGMKHLELWPGIPRGASFGERYERVNEILLRVAKELDIDLWTLDMLWWRASGRGAPIGSETPPPPETGVEAPSPDFGGEHVFGLERYLHEFLVDNWAETVLGSEWSLFEEDGEIVGSHYATGEVGEIDLLAKHRVDNRWLVVELKRNQTSDDTVGQVLRYMGWVRRNLAEPGVQVSGLIICQDTDKKLQYALDGLANVRCLKYRVSFSLVSASES